MTAPFREDFVDAHVPDKKLHAVGRCPWCGTSLSVDPNEVDGVCTGCGARYSTELALRAPARRRRWRRKPTAPVDPPYESPDPIHAADEPRPVVARDLDADERAERFRTILVAMVLPTISSIIFLAFALRAWLR